MYKEEKELWVKFACAVLSSIDQGPYNDGQITEIKRECEAAAAYADEMLRIFYDKFENC